MNIKNLDIKYLLKSCIPTDYLSPHNGSWHPVYANWFTNSKDYVEFKECSSSVKFFFTKKFLIFSTRYCFGLVDALISFDDISIVDNGDDTVDTLFHVSIKPKQTPGSDICKCSECECFESFVFCSYLDECLCWIRDLATDCSHSQQFSILLGFRFKKSEIKKTEEMRKQLIKIV